MGKHDEPRKTSGLGLLRRPQMKNPGQLNRPGLTAGVMLMPSDFARESVIVSQCDGGK